MEHIMIATDAWEPQVNGVVTTLNNLEKQINRTPMQERKYWVSFLTPEFFTNVPLPFYNGITVAIPKEDTIRMFIEGANPSFDYIHIATEGPIGIWVRNWCVKNNKKFTTSYHTNWDVLLYDNIYFPKGLTKRLVKWFHKPSSGVFCATKPLCNRLKAEGYNNVVQWGRGVDHNLFYPSTISKDPKIATFLYVGRISHEKNLEAFLDLELPGIKVLVGSGPALDSLKARYPKAIFKGELVGEALAAEYRAAHVFVFPSKFDTFGMVILEALASGVPVAAFPVEGPKDIITPGKTGILDWDLKKACLDCFALDPAECRRQAENYSWETSTTQFLSKLISVKNINSSRKGTTCYDEHMAL